MAKYIDAEILIIKFKNIIPDNRVEYDDGAPYWDDYYSINQIESVISKMPAADVEPVRKWIPCEKQLPENAKGPDVFRPKYQIYTSFGITEGWYGWSGDTGGWYALIWFMDGRYEEWNIDFEKGDEPKIAFIPDGGKVKVYAWRGLPEPPKMDGGNADGSE